MLYTDKYFTKSKLVAKNVDNDPIVKYRVFGRFNGIAALAPVKKLIKVFAPSAKVETLPEGTPFEAKDTIMILEGRFSELVELETMYLWWAALPCYCAYEANKILRVSRGKKVLDFAARHLYGATSTALASYGAQVGGIKACSTDVGANAEKFLEVMACDYHATNDGGRGFTNLEFDKQGVGTTPHALIAIFRGDYSAMADAYIKTFPSEPFIALIDYNNRELDDSILLLNKLGDKLKGVRIDTCGENVAQRDEYNSEPGKTGVVPDAVQALRSTLNNNGGKHVEIFVSSGFNAEKTDRFVQKCGDSFDGIGTGSFIPKGPTCTADIFEVNGERECKVGREWGYDANERFYDIVYQRSRR